MITIRFVSHPGVFDWACKIAQYGFWATHCDAVLPNGCLLGARFDGGVQIRSANYDAGGFSRELRVSIPATDAQASLFYDFLYDQIGKPFDWQAILTFYFPRDWQVPDSWYCDELLASALAKCGIFPQRLALKFNRISVRDLLLLVSTLTAVDNV